MDEHLPTPDEILAIHEEIEEEYKLKYRGSIYAAPRADLKGILDEAGKYDGKHERAAYLLRSLITSHIFKDGNKRTSWAATWIFLERHGTQPMVDLEEVERVLHRIRRYEVEEIATWLGIGEIDRSRLKP